jgi:hypothetical protein
MLFGAQLDRSHQILESTSTPGHTTHLLKDLQSAALEYPLEHTLKFSDPEL